MTSIIQVVLACLVGVSLGGPSGERIGAHHRPKNPALALSQDRDLFIPLPMVRNVRMQPDTHGHYELDVETADGVRRTEVGNMDNNGNNEVKGVIQYILPDGTPFFLRYIADETGFHPQGNMLPTPPPMPAHSILQMKRAGMLHHSSEEDGMFDSMENDPMFKSMEDMFRSVEDDLSDSLEIGTLQHNHPITGQIKRFHSIEDRFDSLEDRFDSVEGRFDSVEGRFDSVEDLYDSIEDRFDSREDRRVLIRNRENSRANSRALLRNRANEGGVLLRNRKTGKVVLFRNRKIFDSFENGGFTSLEDNTFEDLTLEDNTLENDSLETLEDNTLEDFSLENITDEIYSLENRSIENDSLEFIRRGRRRFLTRG